MNVLSLSPKTQRHGGKFATQTGHLRWTLHAGKGHKEHSASLPQATRDLAFDAIKVDFVEVFRASVVSGGRYFLPIVTTPGRQSEAETQDESYSHDARPHVRQ